MKKFIYTLLFVSTAILTSCNSDDDSPSFDDSINVDGNSIEITAARIVDFEEGSSHYNYDFYLNGSSGDDQYELYLELYSPLEEDVTPSFRTGTFEYNNSGSVEGLYYFSDADIEVNGSTRDAIDGTITVTGSGTNYNVIVSLTLEDDTQLTAEYDGLFTIN